MNHKPPLLILLLSLVVPMLARAQYFPISLNPKTYTSPTGLYTCEVDPSDIYGRGAGHYHFKKNGHEVWSGNYPFTLYAAQITDDGTIGGYAYTFGLEGLSEEGFKKGYGELLIIIMQKDGKVVLSESIPRKFSDILHGNPQPSASLAVTSLGRDILQVRLHYDSHQEWRAYRLSTGKRIEKDEPFADDSHNLSPLSLKPVRGTPLILAHYWNYQNGDVGARFSLLDGCKPPVWNLNLPKDYQFPDHDKMEEPVRRKVRESGAILDISKPNQFSIYTAATAEKLTFQVRPNPEESGKWMVKEIGREPFPYFLGMDHAAADFVEKPLKSFGTIKLLASADLGRVAAATVDQSGQTYLADYRTGAVHVFDLIGNHLHTCNPLTNEFSEGRGFVSLSVGPKGDVYLQPDDMKPIIHFAPDGTRKGLIELKVDFTQQYFPLPRGNRALVLGHQKAVILDATQQPQVIITRRPDRNWLESLSAASIAADGSFAIGTRSGYGDRPWQISLYDHNGHPLKTVEISAGIHSTTFAFSGSFVAALSPTHIHLIDRNGRPVLKSPLPENFLHPEVLTLRTTRKGKELWLVNQASKMVYRYALP